MSIFDTPEEREIRKRKLKAFKHQYEFLKKYKKKWYKGHIRIRGNFRRFLALNELLRLSI